MPTLMLAATKPISLDEIQELIADRYPSKIREILGGVRRLLNIRTLDDKFVGEMNATGEDENSDTMDDFVNGLEKTPEAFQQAHQQRSLHFVLWAAGDDTEAINEITKILYEHNIVQFDSTDDVKLLDGSPLL